MLLKIKQDDVERTKNEAKVPWPAANHWPLATLSKKDVKKMRNEATKLLKIKQDVLERTQFSSERTQTV